MKKYIFSVDHKIIGIQFLFMGLFFFVIGGLLAMLIRWQLAWPSDPSASGADPRQAAWAGPGGVMPPDFYTMVFSMHATIMIFFVIIPLLVGTFGNYLIPLKIGAGDMAFPFLNGLAFWSALPAGAIMLAGFFLAGGAAAAGGPAIRRSARSCQNGGDRQRLRSAANFLRIRPAAPGRWRRSIINFIALLPLLRVTSARTTCTLGNKVAQRGRRRSCSRCSARSSPCAACSTSASTGRAAGSSASSSSASPA